MTKKTKLTREDILRMVSNDARIIAKIPVGYLMDDEFMDQVIDTASLQCQKFVDYITSKDEVTVSKTAYNYMKTVGRMIMSKQKAIKEAKTKAGIQITKVEKPYQDTIKKDIEHYFISIKEDK